MFGFAAPCGVPNKLVLPTATTWLNENPSGPLRRQTGQPLGRTTPANSSDGTRTASSSMMNVKRG
jgi:hypothetical protein